MAHAVEAPVGQATLGIDRPVHDAAGPSGHVRGRGRGRRSGGEQQLPRRAVPCGRVGSITVEPGIQGSAIRRQLTLAVMDRPRYSCNCVQNRSRTTTQVRRQLLTQAQLAELAGVSTSTIYLIECGKRPAGRIRLDVIRKVCKALGVQPADVEEFAAALGLEPKRLEAAAA